MEEINTWGIIIGLAVIFLLIFLNGYFAMAEIALVSVRKTRLEQLAKEGNKRAVQALKLASSTNKLLSTVQVGITLVGIINGVLAGSTLGSQLSLAFQNISISKPISDGISYFILIFLTMYFSMVIGELIPKRMALNNPEKYALRVAPAMSALEWITSPIVKLLSWSTDAGLKLIRFKPNPISPVTEDEIKILMEHGTQVGVFEETEQDLIEGVFRFGDRTIDDIMTPRSDIEWLDLDEKADHLIGKALKSHHTRFVVCKGSLDNVIGILFMKDLLVVRMRTEKVDLRSILKPAIFVPESLEAVKLLEKFKTSSTEIALVIDEYGGLLGLVTLHDVLTAIVGELPLPGEDAEAQVIEREDGSWLIDGLLPIEELKDLLDVEELPDEERIGFQTVGGFMMSRMDGIPLSGQHFEWKNWKFEVVDMDGRRVDKVLVSPVKKTD